LSPEPQLRGDVWRGDESDDRVESLVEAFDHRLEAELILRGIASRAQLPFGGRSRQRVHVINQLLDISHQADERGEQLVILGALSDFLLHDSASRFARREVGGGFASTTCYNSNLENGSKQEYVQVRIGRDRANECARI